MRNIVSQSFRALSACINPFICIGTYCQKRDCASGASQTGTMVEPKPRKRIVPIQITASSPTLPSPPPKSVDLAVEQRGPSISSLKAQAEAAEKGLGLGRKMFVPLAGLDPSKPMVDWKEASWREWCCCGNGARHMFNVCS